MQACDYLDDLDQFLLQAERPQSLRYLTVI